MQIALDCTGNRVITLRAMKQTLAIRQEVEVEVGPAMLSLNERQRLFCVAYYDNGANGAAAARAAGYSDTDGAARVQASRMIRLPKIQEALKELGDAKFFELAPKAIKRVGDLLEMPGHKDHFASAKYVLGQAGFREVKEVNVNTTVNLDDEVKAIMRISAATGLDPRQLAGHNAIDVPFEDVTPDFTGEF